MKKGKYLVLLLIFFVLSVMAIISGLSVERSIEGNEVTYRVVDAPEGKWIVFFEDEVSGGCIFQEKERYKNFFLSVGIDTISVEVFNKSCIDDCSFEGIYQSPDMDLPSDIMGDNEISCEILPIVEDISCSDWSECNVDLSFERLFRGEIHFPGVQIRECIDSSGEEKRLFQEERSCIPKSEISVEKVDWCEENYVEVKDLESEEIVGRLRKDNILENNYNFLNINFAMRDFMGYCYYCFDDFGNVIKYGEPECPPYTEKVEIE